MFDLSHNRFKRYLKHFFKLKPETNHFFIVAFFHAIAGIALPTKRPLWRWIWNVYRSCLVLHYLLCVVRCFLTIKSGESFNAVLINMHVIFSLTINYTRSLIIGANFKYFVHVKGFINDRKYRNDTKSVEIRQKAYEHSLVVTMIFVANIVFQSISIPSTGMTNTDPFQIPIDLTGLPHFARKIVEMWYNLLFITATYISASNFLSMYLAMVGLRAELRVALDSISSIGDYLDYVDGKDGEFEQGEKFWKELHGELKRSIGHHVEVLVHLDVLKNVTNLSFLLLYYMTMLIVAAGVLILTIYPVVDVFYVFAIDYTIRYLIECFVFCNMVSSLNEVQHAIGETLIHQAWISKLKFTKQFSEHYRAVRACILIELMESQRSLRINCGGMFELTLAKFTRIINTSYSLSLFMANFRN
ncbi:AAEL017041-PA [Aedes aegypti]|uniref:Odorant receptor n=2 Tax=Aedes aegypti TaxID=7159 RepID=J9HG16_AEDAE|nr:odorant receptor 60 [Aedes aegypti]EJY57787.1 AAEL017041-PA [Aedes aegypti]DAA80399.1 TPA_exp: odorant receptor 60 [Aedes aegypti]